MPGGHPRCPSATGTTRNLTNAAIDAHRDDPTFGYRFIADEIRETGLMASERRIWRLCSQQGLWSSFSKKRGLNRKAGPPVHEDRVQRAFTAPDIDKVWLTDITEHHTGEGKLYLCAIKDVCSNRIVGYSIDSRMKASLAVSALQMAVQRREPAGTVVHSDRGSQFRSRRFVRAIEDAGLRGSMGRVGACGDNAAMESFFALLQKNVLDRQRWATRQQLRLAIVTWIERTYHRRRRQRPLGRLTPIEFEAILRTEVAPAAQENESTKSSAVPNGSESPGTVTNMSFGPDGDTPGRVGPCPRCDEGPAFGASYFTASASSVTMQSCGRGLRWQPVRARADGTPNFTRCSHTVTDTQSSEATRHLLECNEPGGWVQLEVRAQRSASETDRRFYSRYRNARAY